MASKTIDIHTGLYGRVTYRVLNTFIAGCREHISWSEKNKQILGRHFTGRATDVVTASDGEIVLRADADEVRPDGRNWRWNADSIAASAYSKGVSAADVKSWFASELRKRVIGMGDGLKVLLHPASVTSQKSPVREVRAVADGLDGLDVAAIYGSALGEKVVGRASDPVRTEIASVIAEETKRIQAEFKQRKNGLHQKMLIAISRCREAYRQECLALGKDERKAVSAMKKELAGA